MLDGSLTGAAAIATTIATVSTTLKRPDMRIMQIVGIILIAGGLFVLIKTPSYTSDKSVFKIGDVEAKVAQEHAIPPWIGGAALAAGVLLIVTGARKP
jgi:drug/metabolite transporter (DMT)-like permease